MMCIHHPVQVRKFLAVFCYVLYNWPFQHVHTLQGNLLFFFFILGPVSSNSVILQGSVSLTLSLYSFLSFINPLTVAVLYHGMASQMSWLKSLWPCCRPGCAMAAYLYC